MSAYVAFQALMHEQHMNKIRKDRERVEANPTLDDLLESLSEDQARRWLKYYMIKYESVCKDIPGITLPVDNKD